jgi:hypothetical protein
VAVLAFVAVVHAGWQVAGGSAVAAGELADGDGYLRLVRALDLAAGGGWFDASVRRANAPFGFALHWTRPLDALLIVLAMPLQPFFGFARALYWAGALLGPFLHLGVAATLAWAARPLIGGGSALLAGALTAAQVGVLGYAGFGHADHHVLLALLAVLAFGCVLRALDDATGAERQSLAAGMTLAAGTWVSAAEAQIATALCLAVIGLRWIVAGGLLLGANLRLALGLVAGLVLALLVERGPAELWTAEYDRVSVVHLAAAGAILVFWSAVAVARHSRWIERAGGRLIAAAAGTVAGLGIMAEAFPESFAMPLAKTDPLVAQVLAGIAEFSRFADAGHVLLYLGAALPALPWALWRLGRAWRQPALDRWAWLLLALHAAVYTALTMMWVRWSLYAGVFLAAVLADLVARVDAAIDHRVAPVLRLPVKAVAALALTIGPVAGGAVLILAADTAPTTMAATGSCPLRPLAAFLESPPWNERPRTIVASVNFGPELLYRTRHRVLATLHHRNADGIADSIRVLGGSADADILNVVRRREVDLIVTCERGPHDGYFRAGRGGDVLYLRLRRGDVPAWLMPVTLPPPLAPFRLYEVKAPG